MRTIQYDNKIFIYPPVHLLMQCSSTEPFKLFQSSIRREGAKHFKLKDTRKVNKQEFSPVLLSRSKLNTCPRLFEGWITLSSGKFTIQWIA